LGALPEGTVIIQGGAKGADECARRWANEHSVGCETYHADWKKYGKAAGPIRNRKMLDLGNPDLVIAFPGGNGTQNMVALARQNYIEVKEIEP